MVLGRLSVMPDSPVTKLVAAIRSVRDCDAIHDLDGFYESLSKAYDALDEYDESVREMRATMTVPSGR